VTNETNGGYLTRYTFASDYLNQVITLKASLNARENPDNIPVAGRYIQFKAGVYETMNPREAEALIEKSRNPSPACRVHLVNTEYVCNYPGCDKVFALEPKAREHVKLHDNGEELETEKVPCPECGKEFDSPQALQGHLNNPRVSCTREKGDN